MCCYGCVLCFQWGYIPNDAAQLFRDLYVLSWFHRPHGAAVGVVIASWLSSEVETFFFYRGKPLPPPLLGVGAWQQKWSGPPRTSAPACGGLLSRSFYTNSPTHLQITQPTSFNRVRGLRIMYKYNGLFSDKQRPTAVRGPASGCVRRV